MKQNRAPTSKAPITAHRDASTQKSRSTRYPGARMIIVCSIIFGLSLRLLGNWISPRYSYINDHADYMAWSAFAYEHGPLSLYDMEKGGLINVRHINASTGQEVIEPFPTPHVYNYPPLAAYIFFAEGFVWFNCDPLIPTYTMSEEGKKFYGLTGSAECKSRLVNTRLTRLITGTASTVFDFLLAWGVMSLVVAIVGDAGRRVGALAFATIMVLPPIVLDSAVWNQADSWVGSAMVWCVCMLLRRQWGYAGFWWGIALMMKPQGLLIAPTIACFCYLEWISSENVKLWLKCIGRFAVAVGLCVSAIAGPFAIRGWLALDNPMGSLRWFTQSYVGTIKAGAYESTTLDAFNLWWLDAISNLGNIEAASVSARWFGVQKPFVGVGLFGIVTIAAFYVSVRKRGDRTSPVAFCYLTLLAAFFLLTRVHERYIYYSIPFLVALAFVSWKWSIPLALLTVVGTAEMTTNLWLDLHSEVARGMSVLFSIMTLVSLIVSFVFCARTAAIRSSS